MFHPDEAAMPSSVRPAGISTAGSTAVSSHYATSLKEDMSDLKRRLEVLSTSALRATSFPGSHSQSPRMSATVYNAVSRG